MVLKVCDICGNEIIRGETTDALENKEYKEKRFRVALAMFHEDGSRQNYRDICKDCSLAIDDLVRTRSKKGDAE